jgi:hypothetical protein
VRTLRHPTGPTCPRLNVYGETNVRPQRRVVHARVGMLPAAEARSCACVGGILQAKLFPYLAARCTGEMLLLEMALWLPFVVIHLDVLLSLRAVRGCTSNRSSISLPTDR